MLVNDLKPGSTFVDDGYLYLVLDINRNKSARGQMVIKVKVKNLRNGSTTELSYTAGDKVEGVLLDKRSMLYLYDEGDMVVFMDNDTYDQVSIPKTRLEWELNFLVPNKVATITYYQEEVIGIELPAKVTLQVTETASAVRGDTVTRATKDAVLETGLKLRVPLFIEQDEMIIVNTQTGEYDSRG
jgi:elongation factor P